MAGSRLMNEFMNNNKTMMTYVRTINHQSETNDMSISLDTLRDFLLERNGKVKESDVVLHFPQLTSHDVSVKKNAREKFHHILNIVTMGTEEGGTRLILFVCLFVC